MNIPKKCKYCNNILTILKNNLWNCPHCNLIITTTICNNISMDIFPNCLANVIEQYNHNNNTLCVNYAQLLIHSSDETNKFLKENIETKKLFNFIQNDFTGILNKFKNKSYDFEYYGKLLNDDFVKFVADTLKKVEFFKERYDKRLLKDSMVDFLTQAEEELIDRKKCNNLFSWNEQEVEFMYKILSYI